MNITDTMCKILGSFSPHRYRKINVDSYLEASLSVVWEGYMSWIFTQSISSATGYN